MATKDAAGGGSGAITSYLNFLYANGTNADVKDGVAFVADNSVAFVAGRHVAAHNLDSKDMSFFLEGGSVEEVTYLCVAPNMRNIAVCERHSADVPPQVSIFVVATEKKVRSLQHPDVTNSMQFVSASFSADSKTLVTLCGDPSWTLMLWNWMQSKVLAFVRIGQPVSRMSVSPMDSSQIITSGPGLLKLWRFQETTIKGVSLLSGKNASLVLKGHAWGPKEQVIAYSEMGEVLLLENTELKATFRIPSQNKGVSSVLFTSNLIIAASLSGQLLIYEKRTRDKSEDGNPYALSKTLLYSETNSIQSMAVNVSEDTLACYSNDRQIVTLSLTALESYKDNTDPFKRLCGGFHSDAITGVDVCLRKPLVATSSLDRSVRLWNFVDKVCEVEKSFLDEVLSIAIHPSGFHVLLGFSDKLRLYNVCSNDLRQFKEFAVKGCKLVKFSNGGHLFAAVNLSNILVYNTYTGMKSGVLIAHTGVVTGLAWSCDDLKIVSAGHDGAVYEWHSGASSDRAPGEHGFARKQEHVTRNLHYSCAVFNASGNTCVAASDDGKVREIVDGTTSREIELPQGTKPASLLLLAGDRVLLVGTNNGQLLCFNWSADAPISSEHQTYSLGQGSLSSMVSDAHGKLVFAALDNGVTFTLELHSQGHSVAGGTESIEAGEYFDLILVTKVEMDDKTTAVLDLEHRLGEIQIQSEYKLHLCEQEWSEKNRKLKEELESSKGAAENKFDALMRAKDQQELEAAESIHNLERAHLKAADELESLYEKKLAMEARRFKDMLQEKEDMECSYEEQIEVLKQKYNGVIIKLKQEYETKALEKEETINKLKQDFETSKLAHAEFIRQQEEDHDEEVQSLQIGFRKQLETEQEQVLNLKTQSQIMRRRFDTFKHDMDGLEGQKRSKDETIALLNLKLLEAEQVKKQLEGDIKDRENTIDAKEKRIAELRQKGKELEKVKFVLDFKYKELKKDIEPKEEMIETMKQQVTAMDSELERDVRTNHALGQALNDKTHKIDNLNRELQKSRRLVAEKERLISLFVTDLDKLVSEIDPAYWRDAVRQLYRTYVKKGSSESGGPKDVPDAMDEFARQREHLEKSLSTLRHRGEKNEQAVASHNHKRTVENALLIDELNALRRDKKYLENKVQQLIGDMQREKGPDGGQGGGMLPTPEAGARRSVSRNGPSPAPSKLDSSPRDDLGSSGIMIASSNTRDAPKLSSGKVHKGQALSWGEVVQSERGKVAAMLQQLDENNREIEQQRSEIRRLRQQVQLLVQSGSDTSVLLQTSLVALPC
jgi:WD40 repeat protein